MKEHKYFETFQDMNENFMKKYNIPPREKIQEAFKEIELNLSK